MKKWLGLGLAVLVVAALAAVGGYLVGLSRGETRAREAMSQFGRGRTGPGGPSDSAPDDAQPGQGNPSRARAGTIGAIAAIEGDTIILTVQDGEIKVKVTDTTLVQKTMSVAVDQLAVGEQVLVSGARSEDGSITARSIQAVRAGQFRRSE